MRTIHLWRNRDDAILVQDLDVAAPLESLACIQDEVLSLVIHNLLRNRALTPVRLFSEAPVDFTTARASVVLAADAPPARGTFKLQVGDQTTAAITWPASLASDTEISAFKLDVLAALKALSNVADSDIVADDPTGAVANFLYFRWTALDRDDLIACVENRLIPPTEVTAVGSLADSGFTQLVKFAQLPYKDTTDFTQPASPAVTVVQTQLGATGVNEEQVIIVPPTATGAVAFVWSGATTKSLAVSAAGLTAAAIADALNALPVDGATNPSFAVEQRPSASGLRFTVSFIGPLASAARSLIGVVMSDQATLPYSVGTLDLRDNVRIEQAMNGGKSVELLFELTLDENEKYQLPLTVSNSATGPHTLAAIAGAGGIVTVDRTVYVDGGSLGDSFMEAAPGLAVALADVDGESNTYVITHTFVSVFVGVKVFQRISAGPDVWREMQQAHPLEDTSDNEVAVTTPTDGSVQVVFHFSLSDTELVSGDFNPAWKGNYKVYLTSPTQVLTLFTHQHTWAQVRQSLPSGQTLADKLDAIDAALGVIGGSLKVPAANITGTISTTQIDLASFAAALGGQSNFTSSIASNMSASSVLTALTTALTSSTDFTTTLQTQLSNTTILDTLATNFATNSVFNNQVRELVYTAIQSGAIPGTGTFHLLQEFSAIVPPYEDVPGPIIRTTKPATQTIKVTDGGTETTTQSIIQQVSEEPTTLRLYLPLSPAITTHTDGGEMEFDAPATGTDGAVYEVVDSGVTTRGSALGRPRGEHFDGGSLITYAAGHWYEVVLIGSIYYAKENELILGRDAVSHAEMSADGGARYSNDLPFTLQLEGDTEGRCEVICEIGTRTAASAGNDVASISWATLFTREIDLSPTQISALFNVTIEYTLDDSFVPVLTQKWTAFGAHGETIASPAASAAFDIRYRITKVDFKNNFAPRGALIVRVIKPLASIIAIT